jgi:prepilin-type processing-associated H-X9-DG protein
MLLLLTFKALDDLGDGVILITLLEFQAVSITTKLLDLARVATGSLMTVVQIMRSSPWHPGGANMAMTDGSVRFVKETTNTAVVRALITRAGGEVISARLILIR